MVPDTFYLSKDIFVSIIAAAGAESLPTGLSALQFNACLYDRL